MKFFSIFTLALLLTTTVAANNGNPTTEAEEAVSQLRERVLTLLGTPDFRNVDDRLTSVETIVTFMVNRRGEIVVMTVDADDNYFEGFIKSRLNYRTVPSKHLAANKPYRMKIVFERG